MKISPGVNSILSLMKTMRLLNHWIEHVVLVPLAQRLAPMYKSSWSHQEYISDVSCVIFSWVSWIAKESWCFIICGQILRLRCNERIWKWCNGIVAALAGLVTKYHWGKLPESVECQILCWYSIGTCCWPRRDIHLSLWRIAYDLEGIWGKIRVSCLAIEWYGHVLDHLKASTDKI